MSYFLHIQHFLLPNMTLFSLICWRIANYFPLLSSLSHAKGILEFPGVFKNYLVRQRVIHSFHQTQAKPQRKQNSIVKKWQV